MIGLGQLGVDTIVFQISFSDSTLLLKLPEISLKNDSDKEFGKLKRHGSHMELSICLPRFIREDNVIPFNVNDHFYLGEMLRSIKQQIAFLREHKIFVSLKSIECNITGKTMNCTSSQLINLLRVCLNGKISVYEGVNGNEKYIKDAESLYCTRKNYYTIKCYNKSLEQQSKNINIEDNLFRFELVMVDRVLIRIFGNNVKINDVFTADGLNRIYDEFGKIFCTDIMKKQILPNLTSIENEIYESLKEQGKASRTIALKRKLIVDEELFLRAHEKWRKWKGNGTPKGQKKKQIEGMGLPRNVEKTLNCFYDIATRRTLKSDNQRNMKMTFSM